ncbi:hypothetical protein JTB14_017518 [Gonioctena quinquepunctata]|nr:hypothetical protein JTB14_017518 [Gonioctena quinquepunctata]
MVRFIVYEIRNKDVYEVIRRIINNNMTIQKITFHYSSPVFMMKWRSLWTEIMDAEPEIRQRRGGDQDQKHRHVQRSNHVAPKKNASFIKFERSSETNTKKNRQSRRNMPSLPNKIKPEASMTTKSVSIKNHETTTAGTLFT